MQTHEQQFSANRGAPRSRLRAGTLHAGRLLPLVLVLTPPAIPQAQDFTYTTNNGVLTITGYIGSGGDVTIPSTISGLPVASIADHAFEFNTSLTNVAIPASVTSIGGWAFQHCYSLAGVTIPNSVTMIGEGVFAFCTSLTSATIPGSVTTIGSYAFYCCTNLASVTVGASVTNLGVWVFPGCGDLTGVYFLGDAPTVDKFAFLGSDNVTVYYLPEAKGWRPQVQTGSDDLGVRTNQFGFAISGTSGMAIVVEACTNLASPVWSAVGTNTFADGWSDFNDPQWTNYPARFYRLSDPTFGGRPTLPWEP